MKREFVCVKTLWLFDVVFTGKSIELVVGDRFIYEQVLV